MATTNKAKSAAADNLIESVARWVRVNGGTALIGGGIEIQQWPEDLKYNYRVAVKITGRRPIFKKKKAD